MAFVVIYDACVLYPNTVPPENVDDVLAHLERSGLVESVAALTLR